MSGLIAPRNASAGRRTRVWRRGTSATVTAVLASLVMSLLPATAANAAPEYQITARWADGTPTTNVASGDVLSSEWRVNVNDSEAAPSNEPVQNVTFTTTVANGRIASIPDLCLTTGVDPVSAISDDKKTLTCNIGAQNQGTSAIVVVPVIVDGATGSQVSMTGEINGQPADVPGIPIENRFGMDIRWGGVTGSVVHGSGYVEVDYQWSLTLATGSDPGPDTVTYDISYVTANNSVTNVAPQACTPFVVYPAPGHPWSGGSHPADQMAPFVKSCTLTKIGATGYRMTLTGIDYSRLQVPTRDSQGNALPTSSQVVASGQIKFRVNTTTATGTTLRSSAPVYRAPSGQTSTDDITNNTSTKTITFPGGWSAIWNRSPEYMNTGGTSWDDSIRVSPGTIGYQQAVGSISLTEAATTMGTCTVLDTRYVEYVDRYYRNGWNTALDGGVWEWYVGNNATVNPAPGNTAYNPGNFNCGIADGGWTKTEPANKTTIKAMRLTFPVAQNRGDLYAAFVKTRIKDNVAAGQDVWMFGNWMRDGAWSARMSGNIQDKVQDTPNARFPYTTYYRDILRVVTASPSVTKSVDRAVVRPGIPATYTLNYSANGAGQIPPTVDDFILTDTLPVGMSYVAGSAKPEPGVTTDNQGRQVLTWNLDGVSTNVQHALTYQAVASNSVTPGQILQNSVTATLGIVTTPADTAQVTVSTSGTTDIGKSTNQWFISNPDGDGSGEVGTWTVTLRSQDPLPQAFTDTIDILPYNGDNRGTDFAGTYDVTAVNAPAGATVYYTTADPATLSDDPSHTSNGTTPGSIAGNTVNWSTTPVPNPTAIRVIGGRLAAGATFAFTVTIQPDGAEPGDVWVNRAQAIAEHTELVMRTSEPLTMGTEYSVSLKKYVQDADGDWVDANDVAEYPTYRPGDTVNYRVVVTNTGQGVLTNLVVRDDKQPDLGGFPIDRLEPGEENAYVHEYSITLGDVPGDSLVNNACVDVPEVPADAEDPVQTSCDPAGLTVDGDPTHTKQLISATPIGNGQWQVVFGIDVANTTAYSTTYSLSDALHFTDQATITSASVTASPAGVTLADPAWDGQGNLVIASNVPLAGNDDAGYAPHHYEVTIVADVPLQLDGAGTADDPTECPAEGSDENQGFNNTSELTDARGAVEEDQACAPIPSIDIAKGVSAGPTPNGDGTWTVVYDIVATNSGETDGTYDVTDMMTADGDLEVVSGSVTSAPAGVTPNAGWTGLGAEGAAENVIASGVTLPANTAHTYQVEVVIGIADGVSGAPVITPCDAMNGTGGLSNAAEVEHNDLTDDAEACVTIAFITIDKTVSAGPTPNGDGTWTVVYDIVAENVGGDAGEYDVFDRLHFGDGIDIVSADVVTTPNGVTAEGSWTGLGATDRAAENLIASGVDLAAGAQHTYQVEVTVEVDESTIDPSVLQCPAPGTGADGGLANSTALEHNGIVAQDEVCPTLPLIDIDKTVSAGPTPNGDGTWTIGYDIVVSNRGAAEGDYDLSDRLRFGDGIRVEDAAVTAAPDGVQTNAAWTGEGANGAAENVIAEDVTIAQGASHTYHVEVRVSLDADSITPGALVCPAPGEDGGLANTAGISHNGEDQSADACASLPLIEITKSLAGAVTPVPGEPGVYDAVYEVTVTNRGAGTGVYDLDDRLSAGDGVQVRGIQAVTTDAPAPVGINSGFDGLNDVRIVTGQPIAGATADAPVVHTYLITVRYAADLSAVEGPVADVCSVDGAPAPGTLSNVAAVDWNGIVDEDDECLRPGKPTLDKALVSARPVGDGSWEVVYDLTVGNTGDEATVYDLDDEFLFAPAVTAESATVTGPAGVTVNAGFDGDADQRIATGVTIAGLDDDGYAPHVYRVTVIASVPLAFDEPEADGTGSPACTVGAGANFTEQGLNNAATLTDETGGEITDTDCAPLPSFRIGKAMAGDPVKGSGGAWTVSYDITVTNTGAAAGEYTLTDRLRYGAGILVKSAAVASAPDGVALAAGWTGLGADGAAENVVSTGTLAAGATHTYRVVVMAVLDTDAADASTLACPAAGSDQPGGFANTAGIAHNDLAATADACATPEWPEDVPPPLAITGGRISMGLIGGALLLLIAGGLFLSLRRRREALAE